MFSLSLFQFVRTLYILFNFSSSPSQLVIDSPEHFDPVPTIHLHELTDSSQKALEMNKRGVLHIEALAYDVIDLEDVEEVNNPN